jgi:hypothetical protein
MKFDKVLKEYKSKFTTKPSSTGDTDLSPSADYGSYTSSSIIPQEVDNGYEEFASETIDYDSRKWKTAKNKFDKMNWEQPEPNDPNFSSSSVQSVPAKETQRLNHNKNNVNRAYKRHELPDIQGYHHLIKMDKERSGDPLDWQYYRKYFRPKNRMKK